MAVCVVLPEELAVSTSPQPDLGGLKVVSSRVVHFTPHRGETVASAIQRICTALKTDAASFHLCRGSALLSGSELLELPSPGCEVHLVRRQAVDVDAVDCGIEVFNCGVAMPRRLKWAVKEVSGRSACEAAAGCFSNACCTDPQRNVDVSSNYVSGRDRRDIFYVREGWGVRIPLTLCVLLLKACWGCAEKSPVSSRLTRSRMHHTTPRTMWGR